MKSGKLTTKVEFNKKDFALDILLTILGTSLLVFSIHTFTAPNQIAPGGVTGISIIINYLTGLPIGAINITLNIPIIIIGIINLGKRFMIKTFVSLITFTFVMDYVLVHFPVYTGEKIVAAIFGGLIMGLGIGLVFKRSSSTGGMDILNRIIAKRLPHIKLGKITFSTDMVIIAISAIAFKSVEPALYSIITLYISATALDMVLYGLNVCKLMYIVSDKADEIAKRIMTDMNRGATIMESYGAYTNVKRPTIMCAVRQNEYIKLKKIISSVDENAFIIISSATEIVGSGFKNVEL